MSEQPLAQWLQRLENIHPAEIELGLERVTAVAQRLELLPVKSTVVTVAGTNGKGSTVAVLEALLNAAGQVAGVYTSPHLLRFNERIRVAGVEADDAQICAAFAAIDSARESVSLTYFEFATLAALWIFRQRQVDCIVLEVGLGGRLDAVNIVDPTIAVITTIALDHQDWLGESLAQIAREKAGILRAGRPLVVSDPAPPPELLQAAREAQAEPVYRLGQAFNIEQDGGGWYYDLQTPTGERLRLGPLAAGSLLAENVAGALQAALLLGLEVQGESLGELLLNAAPTARLQLISENGGEYLLDVAHNTAAVERLLKFAAEHPVKGRSLAVFSVMADKDVKAMVQAAQGAFDAWFLAEQPHNSRAAGAGAVADLLRASGQSMISVSKNVRQAFRRAQSLAGPGDRIVVFGSFYTVAEVLPVLEKDRKKTGKNNGVG